MEQKLTIHKNQASALNPRLSWDPSNVVPSLWSPVSFDPLWWDNDVFASTRRNMTQMFDNFFDNWLALGVQPSNANISEDQRSLRIKMDVPGIEAEDIDISTANGMLTISADREENVNGTETRYSFSHSVSLPEDVNVEQAHVNFANHRLSIEIPKGNGAAPRPAISHTLHKKQAKARHKHRK